MRKIHEILRLHFEVGLSFHMELRKKGVTRHLLWEEYCQRMPVRGYSYSQFCCRYQT